MKKVEDQFESVDKLFEKLAAANKDALDNAKIKPIHDKFPYAQNGICALIAPMGAGKTYNYLKMIAQQERLFDSPFYELVVICSTSDKFDKTVETFKSAITKSKLVHVKDVDLLSWLNKYMRRMLKYNAINDFLNGIKNFTPKPNSKQLLEKIETNTEELQRSIRKYGIKNDLKLIEYLTKKLLKYKWKSFPHRCLLVLDDFASHPLVRSKETEMSRLLKKLRHFNINVIICVQTTKSLPPDIKRILHDCVLFPGISEEDFNDLMKIGPFGVFDRKQLWNEYRKLSDSHSSFRIHIAAKMVVVNRIINQGK